MPFSDRRLGANRLQKLSDEALCQRFAEGNQDAFLELFDRYWKTVLTLAHSVLRNRAEAEDVAQILFVEIHANLLQFDETRGSFRALLLRAAYTKAIDHRRHLQCRQYYSNVEIEAVDADALVRDSLLIYGLTLEEASYLIAEAIEHLDEQQRATVHAYFFRGLSLSEVALELNESLGNARHHLYRGLEKMRRVMISSKPVPKQEPVLRREPQSSEGERQIVHRLHRRFSDRLPSELSNARSQSL
jgi:RNA polymerase sigma-70 factor (ECF subfamily)